MDLIQILHDILYTKNRIRDIIGETDNIARYYTAIHNYFAQEYNKAYREGFHDRYYELTSDDLWVEGPEEYLPYNISAVYYDKFTAEILTDIMRDVLNYRLSMKDELNKYLSFDVGDEFELYPDYLLGIRETIHSAGVTAGSEAADEAYDGDDDVNTPSFSYSNNRFTITTSQTSAALFYKLDADGIETLYTGPVTISQDYDVYFWARIGRSTSPKTNYQHCTYSDSGLIAFVYPPVINQEGNKIYLTSNTEGCTIEYKIDNGLYNIYNGVVLVNPNDQYITARCLKDNEYSKHNSQAIRHGEDDGTIYPENVLCTIVDNGSYRTVTLSCSTPGAAIYYALNENGDGFFRLYSQPFTEEDDHFIVYVYSLLNGVQSKNILYYVYNGTSSANPNNGVQFIDQGNSITIYCIDDGVVCYRYGSSGEYTTTNLRSITLRPTSPVTIYAFSIVDGVAGNEQSYYFDPSSYTGKPPKPTMVLNGDVVSIYSYYKVLYTTDLSDPAANGITYNAETGITITDTTTIKAVAVNNGIYSDEAVSTFTPYGTPISDGGGGDTIPDGPGGGGGGGQGGGGSEPVLVQDCLRVKGVSAISFSGYNLEYTSDGNNWIASSGNAINGLDPEVTYYLRGNITKFNVFSGAAVLSGKCSSVITNSDTLNFTGLFMNCSGLKNVSGLDFNTGKNMVFKQMFMGCTSLENAEFTIGVTDVADNAFEEMFSGCTSLNYGPQFTITSIGEYGCRRMFYNCSSLVRTGQFALGQDIGDNAMEECFCNCSQLYSVILSTGQTKNTIASYAFRRCFAGCSNLDVSKISLNLTSLATGIYYEMFKDCKNIVNFGTLPAINSYSDCYHGMFEGCTKLKSFGNIALDNVSASCCMRMFYGCTSLTSAPRLNAANIFGANDCYKEMFYGCSNLNYIEAMFTNSPVAGNYTANWVKNVASKGTFVYNNDATWVYASGNYGPNAIPVGWNIKKGADVGQIKSITCLNGMVTIVADRNDDIYYSLTSTSNLNPQQMNQLYTGPFQIYESTYVNAVCKNVDGVFGSPSSVYCELKYPVIVASCSNNTVKIYCPYDFEYDLIEYKLCRYNSTSIIQNYKTYTDPFTIEINTRVVVRGKVGANYSSEFIYDIVVGLNAPVIEFKTRYCSISLPNAAAFKSYKIYYKVNDASIGNPPEGWTQFNGDFVYTDKYVNGVCLVTAIAQVTMSDNTTAWTSIASKQASANSTSVDLGRPIFEKTNDSENNVVLKYDGQYYDSWNRTDVKIAYKFFQGGATRYYTQIFSLMDAGQYASCYISVWGRAESGTVTTEWEEFRLYYDNSLVHFDVNAPTISVRKVGSQWKIYITNDTAQPDYYSIENYFKIEVTEWDASNLKPNESVYNTFVTYSAADGFVINEHVKHATVYAYSKINNDQSGISAYEFDNPDIITSAQAPTIQFVAPSTSTGAWKIKVNSVYSNVTRYYRAENCEWAASGTVDEHKYDNWKVCPSSGDSIDTHLGSATFYAYITYNGLDSPESEGKVFYDERVSTVLQTPTAEIQTIYQNGVYYYKLVATNPNENTLLKFQILDKEWNGGVINTDKYNNLTSLPIYGEILDEHLISGRILVYSMLDLDHMSDPYEIIFESGYTGLQIPEAVFLEGSTTTNAFKCYNINPLATNQFRIANVTYDGTELNHDWGATWSVCFVTFNDIPDYIVECDFYFRSVWGNEVATVSQPIHYESGIVINSDPPTIFVTQNNDGVTYTVTMTRNADYYSYPRIKWMMTDLVLEGDYPSTELTRYMKPDAQDHWKIENTGLNTPDVSFTISEYVAKGTIQCFSTDNTSSLLRYHAISNNTALATYEFER